LSSWPLESRATRAARWSALEVVALLLIGAGIVGLAFDGISYTRAARLGFEMPIEITGPVRQSVFLALSLGAAVLGGAFLLARRIAVTTGANARLRWPR
jgi:hypothetical protein